MFREQGYVERCYCEAEAVRGCGCCGRARCESHLSDSLCDRCSRALTRELATLTGRAWAVGGVVGAVGVLGLMVAHVGPACILAAPAGIVAGYLQRRLQRRSVQAALAPVMSATKGELAAPPEPPAFPSAPTATYGSY